MLLIEMHLAIPEAIDWQEVADVRTDVYPPFRLDIGGEEPHDAP